MSRVVPWRRSDNLRGLSHHQHVARSVTEGRSRLSSRAARATYPAPAWPTRIISASSSRAACISASAGSACAATSVAPIPRSFSNIRRRRAALSARRRAARGAGRQGLRLGLVTRLGGEGHRAAGRARGDRRELRAHPPLEPRRHRRPAAAVRGRRERVIAGLDGEEVYAVSGVADALNAGELPRDRDGARRRSRVHGARAHRHPRKPSTSVTEGSSSTCSGSSSPSG